jgi:hypothetical protein
MSVPTRRNPGFRIWAWERGLLGAFAGVLAAFAAAVLTVAFTFTGRGKVAAFVIAGILAIIIFALLYLSANRNPVPDGPVPVLGDSAEPKVAFVDDITKVIGKELGSVGHEQIAPPPGPA